MGLISKLYDNDAGQCGSVGGSIDLYTRGSQVPVPVRAHALVAGLIPGQSMYKKATDQCFSLTSMFPSLPIPLLLPYPLSKSNQKMSLDEDLKDYMTIYLIIFNPFFLITVDMQYYVSFMCTPQ